MSDDLDDVRFGGDQPPGSGPPDFEDLLQRNGRRLFVLAYYLCGGRDEAESLSCEAFARRCLAPIGGEHEAGPDLHLYGILVRVWRERTGAGAGKAATRRAGRGRDAAAPAGPTAVVASGPAFLPQMLARLGPELIEVLALRIGDGLDYPQIAAVLEMPVAAVRDRLIRGRRELYRAAGGREIVDEFLPPAVVHERINLYLDGRLPDPVRAEFERRMERDLILREAVEFHRGLSLEFQEEAPPLPRGFLDRARAQAQGARALEAAALVERGTDAAAPADELGAPASVAAAPTTPVARRRWSPTMVGGGAVLVLVVGIMAVTVAKRRRDAGALPSTGAAGAAPTATPVAADDPETIRALQSLGYLAGGAGQRPAPAQRQTPAPTPRPTPPSTPAPSTAAKPAAKIPTVQAIPVPSPIPAAAPSPPIAEPTPAPVEAAPPGVAEPTPPGAAPAPSLASTAPSQADPAPPPAPVPTAVAFRVAPVGKVPELGRDHQIIRAPEEWAALFAEAGSAPPAVDFAAEMVVLLRADLGSDPPSSLRVLRVTAGDSGVEIHCGVVHAEPGGADVAASPGQGVVLPATDRLIRILME